MLRSNSLLLYAAAVSIVKYKFALNYAIITTIIRRSPKASTRINTAVPGQNGSQLRPSLLSVVLSAFLATRPGDGQPDPTAAAEQAATNHKTSFPLDRRGWAVAHAARELKNASPFMG